MSAHQSEDTGRFRPASTSDFSHYAKNLAWLLDCKLQEAQELLARCYGYANAHELRAEMSKPGLAGPYDSPTRWPLFSGYRAPADHLAPAAQPGDEEDLSWLSETPFDKRLRQHVQKRATRQGLGFRELGCLEAGFFCAPKVHRRLFAHVKVGCLAQEGSPDQQLAWFQREWPVGYWPLLRILYGHTPVVPPDTPTTYEPPILDEACLRLCRLRAPGIYLRMTEVAPADGFDPGPPEYATELQVELSGGRAGLYPEDPEALRDELAELLAAHRVTVPHSEWEAVETSQGQFLAAGGTDNRLLHPLIRDIEGIAGFLLGQRFRYLKALAEAQSHDAGFGVLRSRGAWPNQFPDLDAKHMDLMTLAMLRRDEMRVMLDCTLTLHQASRNETEDCHMSLWRYHAQFAQVYETGAPGMNVGSVSGWFIVPYDEESRVHPHDFFECMDAASAQLNDVWKVLQGDYFPKQGMESIADFLDQNGMACMATAEVELVPQFRGKRLVPELLAEICDCLDNAPFSCVDSGWAAHAQSAADPQRPPDFDEDLALEDPSLPFFRPPAVFVMPVEGEPPQDRTLHPQLRGTLAKVRKPNSRTAVERTKRKLMRHFESMAEDAGVDIVCYDPYDYPAT